MLIRLKPKNIYILFTVFALENLILILYFLKLSSITANKRLINTSTKVDRSTPHGPSLLHNNRRINSTWLDHHPIYKKFYVEDSKDKKIVTILVIVSSAPKRLDRRNAIRETWWTQCHTTKEVIPECIFMTDYQGPNDEYFHEVRVEEREYKDIYFQLVNSGVTFGRRFINHMLFAVKKYEFDYFLRVDDDYFLCFESILLELPTPSLHFFHWGWVHRHDPIGLQRAEESLILFSHDVIESFLLQDPMQMFCHPLADQMIAKWLSVMNITTLLRHDDRIHHHPPVRQSPEIFFNNGLCKTYIAIHGSYPDDMKHLWEERGTNLSNVGDLRTYSFNFPVHVPFDWRLFDSFIWRYQPKLCINDPIWDTSKQMDSDKSYTGRQGDKSTNGDYDLNEDDSKNAFQPENELIDIINQKLETDDIHGEDVYLNKEKEFIKNSKESVLDKKRNGFSDTTENVLDKKRNMFSDTTENVLDKKRNRLSDNKESSTDNTSIDDFLNDEDNVDIQNFLSE